MLYLQILFSSFIISLIATPFLIRRFIKSGVVDNPDGERRVHTKITPRMGGIIVFAVALVMIFGFYENINDYRFFVISMLVMIACGILDDLLEVAWNIKFLLQFVSIIFLMIQIYPAVGAIEILGFNLPLFLGYIILFVFAVGTVNSINLMDGLDGLVSGYSLIKMAVILQFAFLVSDDFLILLSLTVIGSLLGFIKFNAFPARIFLGDTGSLILGLFLVFGSLSIAFKIGQPGVLDLTFPIILLGVPILDTLKVMFVRLKNKKNPFHPDKNHLHHIILGSNVKHKTSVFIIQLFSIAFSVIAFGYYFNDKLMAVLFFVLLAFLLLGTKYIFRKINVSSLVSVYNIISYFPSRLINNKKKYFLFMTAIASVALIITSFPAKNYLNYSQLFFLVLFTVSIAVISFFHNRKAHIVNHIYVFFNLGLFFALYNYVRIKEAVQFQLLNFDLLTIHYFSAAFLVIVLILFLISREYVIPKNHILLNGYDLILLVFITLSFITQTIIQSQVLEMISSSILLAFIVYLWYKIVVITYPKISRLFFYFSYALPIITLIFLFTTL